MLFGWRMLLLVLLGITLENCDFSILKHNILMVMSLLEVRLLLRKHFGELALEKPHESTKNPRKHNYDSENNEQYDVEYLHKYKETRLGLTETGFILWRCGNQTNLVVRNN